MIRKLAVRALQALVLVTLLGVGLPPAYAETDPVRVPADVDPADAGWVNSGVLVVEGEIVYLQTEGMAITAPLVDYPGARSGPEGQTWNLGCGQYEGAPPPCALDDAPYGALLGLIGDGEPFLIGGASSFTPTASGPLYLAVNDNLGFYDDNQGGFTVLFNHPVAQGQLGLAGEWHRLNPDQSNPTPEHEVLRCGGDAVWNCTYDKHPEPLLGFENPPDSTSGRFRGENITSDWTCPGWFPSDICDNTTFIVGGVMNFVLSDGAVVDVSQELILTESEGEQVLYVYWVDQFVCPWYRTFDEALAANPFPLPFNGTDRPAQDCVVELELMGWASSEAETTRLQEVIDTFNAQHPTIHVTMNLVPDYDAALDARFASGTPPDVFYVDSFRLPDLAEAGWLAVGGDLIQMPDDFYPSLREAFTYQDDFYCPPKDFSTLALLYNRDMFEAAGVGVPTTWDELQSSAEALTDTDTETGVYGLVLPADFARWIAFLYQAGGSVTDPDFTQMTINSDEGAAALQFYTDFVLDGFAATPSQVDAGWAGEAFGQQKAAMVIEGNWVIPYLRDFFPDLNFGVAELPAGPVGQATMAFTVCYAVPADAAHPEESWTLVNWLTGPQGMQQWTDLGLAMPSRQSLRDHWIALFPELEPFLNGAAYAHEWQFVPGFGDVVATVNDNIQRIFGETQTVGGALEEIEAVGNEVLGF